MRKEKKRTRNSIWTFLCIVAICTAGVAYVYLFLCEPLAIAGAAVFLVLGVLLACSRRRPAGEDGNAAEREVRYREELFDALSHHVDDVFLLLENDGKTVNYVSSNVERLLGVPRERVMRDFDSICRTVADGEKLITEEELAGLERGQQISRECAHIHWKSGERRWYQDTFYRLSVHEADKIVLVLSDHTKENRMNEGLREALETARIANEAKSNFLANMSHDIRTPMNAIIGFATLLTKDAEDPEKVREYTKKISASGQHLLGLINDVLDMSKIESGATSLNIGEFSLPDLLEEISLNLMPQAKAKHQSFDVQMSGKVPEVLLGDRMRVNQVLLNLVSSSIKYTQDGGKVELTIYNIQMPTPDFVHLRFVVNDNGAGMSEETLKTLFDPFAHGMVADSQQEQGTELSMAITKSIVDLMGGSINVTSKPDEGTVVVVELEFSLPQRQRDEHFWARYGVTKLLVVDDDEETCIGVQRLMQDTGVLVEYATDGYAAIEKVVGAHTAGEDYDAVLLDWKMPGLHGVDVARRIRAKLGEDILLFILTGYDWSDIEREAKEAGVDAFVQKPFFVSNFQQSIEKLRDQKPAMREKKPQEGEDTGGQGVLNGKLFLVAEDIELNAELLSAMLSMEGAKCEIAENGQRALEMFRNSEPGYYDVILMDVQMPVMNGYEATRQIRSCGHPDAKTIRIVAMTANAFLEDVQNALDAGMDAHVAKPVDMEVVKQTLQRLEAQS